MNTTLNTPVIRKPRTAKQPFSRLSDGIKHPVVVTLAKTDPSAPAKG